MPSSTEAIDVQRGSAVQRGPGSDSGASGDEEYPSPRSESISRTVERRRQ